MPVTIWAPETLVNTTTTNAQTKPSVATLNNGGYVIVWQSFNTTPEAPGEGTWDIRAQRFGAEGTALGAEFSVSSDLAGDQTGPVVTALANGGFTVSWLDAGQVENRRFDPLGAAVTADVANGGVSALGGLSAATTRVGAGRVEAVEYQGDIHLLRYDSAGLFVSNIVFNTTTAGTQTAPDVARLADGKHVVAWVTDGVGVRARWIHENGVLVNNDFAVNTTPVGASIGHAPKVTGLANGGFVIVWEQTGVGFPGSSTDIRARLFDNFGNALGDDFLVNLPFAGHQEFPDVVALADGGFVAVWADENDFTIKGQRFDAFGDRVGSTIVVSTEGGALVGEDGLSAALTTDGRIVVTWEANTEDDDPSESAIHSVILDPREGVVTGGFLPDTLYGGAGTDQLVGQANGDLLYGLAGADQAFGGSGADTLHGGAGDDGLHGQGGADLLLGEEGDDSLHGGVNHDTLEGGVGADALNGGSGDDQLTGGVGADTLEGGAGYDTAAFLSAAGAVKLNLATGVHTGEAAGDVFWGLEAFVLTQANDEFVGAGEADWASGEGGNDKLEGGEGADTLLGGDGLDTLTGEDDGDVLNGGLAKDTLTGGGGDDLLAGGDGEDAIDGGTEADTLSGGFGRDLLTGGAGADRFVWFDAAETGTTGGTRDQVKDFNRAEGDILDLSDIDAVDGGPGDVTDEAFTFVAAFTGVAGQLRSAGGGGGTFSLVQGDIDGDGVADFVIQVFGSAPLTAADFVL